MLFCDFQQDTCEVQLKNMTSVNLDKTYSWTLNRAFGSEKSGTNGAVETSSNDLHVEGLSQLPHLLPSRSPPLTQERRGILPPKHNTGTPTPASTPGIKNRLALPALSPKLQMEAVEEKVFGCGEQSISSSNLEVDRIKGREESSFSVAEGGIPSSSDFAHSGNQEILASPTVIEPPTSWNQVSLPGLDGILKQCALSFVGRTRGTEDQSEKVQKGSEENVNASTTGIARRFITRFCAQVTFLSRSCLESS